MSDDDPLASSPLGPSFREAHRVLLSLAGPGYLSAAKDGDLQDVVEELGDLVRVARDTAAAHLGPVYSWRGSRVPDDPWQPITLQIDLDGRSDEDPAGISNVGEWEDSALALAARAYRRECGWTFAPDEAGIWLLAVAPYSGLPAGRHTYWRGSLTGFAVLHDRDGDGAYESLAHLWTAQVWRRRGVGAGLVRLALERFPVRRAEGPFTEAGRRLLERCAPGLLT